MLVRLPLPAPYSVWKSGQKPARSNVNEELNVTPMPLPVRPDLVVMMMAPLAAREP